MVSMNWIQDIQKIQNILSEPRFGLVTDVDGTISPIVNQPEQAVVHPEIIRQLHTLAGELPLVGVISGRMVSDVSHRVGIDGIVYIGNHGLERMVGTEVIMDERVMGYRNALVKAKDEISSLLLSGMTLEDKTVTLSVHFRNAKDQDSINQVIYPLIAAITRKHGLKLFSGRKVFELRPPVEINKGTALQNLIEEYSLTAALYIGDDTTDVAAFRSARKMRRSGICRAFGVGVLSPDTSEEFLRYSDWTVAGVEGVKELFSFIARSRSASST